MYRYLLLLFFGLQVSNLCASAYLVDGYLLQRAHSGDLDAQLQLAEFYGEGVEKNIKQSFYWYEKVAKSGNSQVQNILGNMYKEGLGVSKDYEQAFLWYSKSAKQGNTDAQNNLGYLYQEGLGVDQDNIQAIEWYNRSAEQGNTYAQNNLGYMYAEGKGVPKSYEKAIQWYKKSAEKGNVYAQKNLAYMYGEGTKNHKDLEQSFKWYKLAAEQGDVEAQFMIGRMYWYGVGVAQDYPNAVLWFKKAGGRGSNGAQRYLGAFYSQEKATETDLKQAFYWYRKSAEGESSLSKYAIAKMYLNGKGTKKDTAQALYWYKQYVKSSDFEQDDINDAQIHAAKREGYISARTPDEIPAYNELYEENREEAVFSALKPPTLVIEKIDFDGKGNDLEFGEIRHLQIAVRNKGEGYAKDVVFLVNNQQHLNGIEVQSPRKPIPMLHANELAIATCTLRTNIELLIDTTDIVLIAKDVRGAVSAPYTITVHTKGRNALVPKIVAYEYRYPNDKTTVSGSVKRGQEIQVLLHIQTQELTVKDCMLRMNPSKGVYIKDVKDILLDTLAVQESPIISYIIRVDENYSSDVVFIKACVFTKPLYHQEDYSFTLTLQPKDIIPNKNLAKLVSDSPKDKTITKPKHIIEKKPIPRLATTKGATGITTSSSIVNQVKNVSTKDTSAILNISSTKKMASTVSVQADQLTIDKNTLLAPSPIIIDKGVSIDTLALDILPKIVASPVVKSVSSKVKSSNAQPNVGIRTVHQTVSQPAMNIKFKSNMARKPVAVKAIPSIKILPKEVATSSVNVHNFSGSVLVAEKIEIDYISKMALMGAFDDSSLVKLVFGTHFKNTLPKLPLKYKEKGSALFVYKAAPTSMEFEILNLQIDTTDVLLNYTETVTHSDVQTKSLNTATQKAALSNPLFINLVNTNKFKEDDDIQNTTLFKLNKTTTVKQAKSNKVLPLESKFSESPSSNKMEAIVHTKVVYSLQDASDIDIDIPKRANPNPNIYALVIGNKIKTKESFYDRDALAFAFYSEKMLGVPKKNLKLLLNANHGIMMGCLYDLLNSIKTKKDAVVYVYFAGRTKVSEEMGETILLPYQMELEQEQEEGISVENICSLLSQHTSTKVLLFLECSLGSKTLKKNLGNSIALYAASSSPLSETVTEPVQKHSLFTYYLLKTLRKQSTAPILYKEWLLEATKKVEQGAKNMQAYPQKPVLILGKDLEPMWNEWSCK